MKVTLTKLEERIARYLRKVRVDYYRTHKPETITLYGSCEGRYEETMLHAIGAEIAYCRIMNVSFCMEEIDGRYYDAQLPNGLRIDVKNARFRGGPLHAKPKERSRWPDWFALMEGKMPTFRLVGHAPAHLVMSPSHMDPESKSGNAQVVQQHELITRFDFWES